MKIEKLYNLKLNDDYTENEKWCLNMLFLCFSIMDLKK